MQTAALYRLALLAGLLQTCISVANGFVVRQTASELSSSAVTMLRLLLTSVVIGLSWLVSPRRLPRMRTRDGMRAALLGLVGVTLNQAVYIAGVAQSTPARASLIYALVPILVLVTGVLRGTEIFSLRLLIATMAGFVGVVVVLSEHAMGSSTLRGDVLLLCGSFCWSFFTAGSQALLKQYGAPAVTAVSLAAGGAFAVPFAWPTLRAVPWAAVSVHAWLGIIYLVLVASIAAYALWYFAIQHLSASRAAVFNYLQPPLAALATAWFLHEPITPRFVEGGALILGGLVLAQSRGRAALSWQSKQTAAHRPP